MKKSVIIINGAGGTGKDTLCRVAGLFYPVKVVSTVDRVKEIARFGGWDGLKDERGRRLLSDVKLAFVEYGDMPFRWTLDAYRRFLESGERILFIHCREAGEIDKLRRAMPGSAALLVRRKAAPASYGNASDDGVENYRYDYTFENDGPLSHLEADFLPLLRRMINEQ